MDKTGVVVEKDVVPVLIRVDPKGFTRIPISAVTIYYKVPGWTHDPNKPSKVAWVVSGNLAGREIYIHAKPDAHFGYMSAESYGPIREKDPPLVSDVVKRGPPQGTEFMKWRYFITLVNELGVVVDQLDPEVDIGNDP